MKGPMFTSYENRGADKGERLSLSERIDKYQKMFEGKSINKLSSFNQGRLPRYGSWGLSNKELKEYKEIVDLKYT